MSLQARPPSLPAPAEASRIWGFLLISIRGNPMVDYGSLSADERSVSRCVEEPWALR